LALRRHSLLLVVLVILVLAVIAGVTWANYHFSASNPGGNDFLARWNGARFWVIDGISPYDDRVGLSAQEMIYGHPADISAGEDQNLFVYP
jgi:hypothetical protein